MSSDIQIGVALALGQLAPNLRSIVVIGHNTDVSSTEEDVWEGGGTYTFLSAAAELEVLSSSASDTAAGVGARSVRVTGLDADGFEKTVDVALDGTTPVSLGSFLRVNGGFVLTSGSNGTNVGTITARTVVGATSQLVIAAGNGFHAQFIYTVPKNYNAIVGTFFFSTEQTSGGEPGANSTRIVFYSRANGSGTWLHLAEFSACDNVGTIELQPYPPASVFPELTDIRFAAQCASANMRVNAGMTLTLARSGVSFAPRFTSWGG